MQDLGDKDDKDLGHQDMVEDVCQDSFLSRAPVHRTSTRVSVDTDSVPETDGAEDQGQESLRQDQPLLGRALHCLTFCSAL